MIIHLSLFNTTGIQMADYLILNYLINEGRNTGHFKQNF